MNFSQIFIKLYVEKFIRKILYKMYKISRGLFSFLIYENINTLTHTYFQRRKTPEKMPRSLEDKKKEKSNKPRKLKDMINKKMVRFIREKNEKNEKISPVDQP